MRIIIYNRTIYRRNLIFGGIYYTRSTDSLFHDYTCCDQCWIDTRFASKENDKRKIYHIFYIYSLSWIIDNLILQLYAGQKNQMRKSQEFAYLDIAHQFVILINYGQSHLANSIFYFIFLISRAYMQISIEYTNNSIIFIIFGSLFAIDQYQKHKQKRKLFLKGQSNKLLEKLIKEFIDEKVCIVEKDEDSTKFIPIIINEKMKELSDDISLTLKSLLVCQKRVALENYLYSTIQKNETLLCSFKNRIFEVKYQRYIIKKCQFFIKIKEIYQNQVSIINYKELYFKQQNQLKRLAQSSYQAKQILQLLRDQMFLFWFQKYHLAYRIKIEPLNIAQLKNILTSKDFQIIKYDTSTQIINTDKLLLNLLINSIEKFFHNKSVMIQQNNHGIQIDTYGVISHPIKEQLVAFMQKLLFHIGFGSFQIKRRKCNNCSHLQLIQIQIKLDSDDISKYYIINKYFQFLRLSQISFHMPHRMKVNLIN